MNNVVVTFVRVIDGIITDELSPILISFETGKPGTNGTDAYITKNSVSTVIDTFTEITPTLDSEVILGGGKKATVEEIIGLVSASSPEIYIGPTQPDNTFKIWIDTENNFIYALEDDVWTVIGSSSKGISSISKTNTTGLVDTYTITYTDSTTSTYTVTNGSKGDTGSQGEKGDKGDTGLTGSQGIQGVAGLNGSNGTNGTSAVLNLSLFKQGSNGIVYPQMFKWTVDKTVSTVELLTNCSEISVTIGSNTYNHTTLIGVTLTSGTVLIINDITVQAGYDNANAIIIF